MNASTEAPIRREYVLMKDPDADQLGTPGDPPAPAPSAPRRRLTLAIGLLVAAAVVAAISVLRVDRGQEVRPVPGTPPSTTPPSRVTTPEAPQTERGPLDAALDDLLSELSFTTLRRAQLSGAAGPLGDIIEDLARMYGPDTTPSDVTWSAADAGTCVIDSADTGHCSITGSLDGRSSSWTVSFSRFTLAWQATRASLVGAPSTDDVVPYINAIEP